MIKRGQLLIDNLVGETIVLNPGQQLTAGRAADFPIATDDLAMHRHFLQFWDVDGVWMMKNVGSFLTVTLSPAGMRAYSPIRIVPQSTATVPLGTSVLRFSTKTMRYEIELVQGLPASEPDLLPVPPAEFTRNTFEPNYEQRRVMEALARPLLEDPAAVPRVVIPTTQQLAEQLGWGEKKTAQKIQYIAETLQRLGVPEFQEGISVPWRLLVARFAAENPSLFRD